VIGLQLFDQRGEGLYLDPNYPAAQLGGAGMVVNLF
jgi:hypothetical protein